MSVADISSLDNSMHFSVITYQLSNDIHIDAFINLNLSISITCYNKMNIRDIWNRAKIIFLHWQRFVTHLAVRFHQIYYFRQSVIGKTLAFVLLFLFATFLNLGRFSC